MDRSYLRATRDAEAMVTVAALQKQQFVRPHQTVLQALLGVGQEVRLCPTAVERAMNWLQIDAQKAIGRLRKSELLQLARSIQRFWRQNALRAQPIS